MRRIRSSTTPSRTWLGVVVLGLWILGAWTPGACIAETSSEPAKADCGAPENAETVSIAKVQDGDSLRLADGRSVRLLGINAPELRGPEPLAVEARDALRRHLGERTELLLAPGHEPRDRYGRTLATAYRQPGEPSLGAWLLRQGLGWQVAIPPNLDQLDCLSDAEAEARHYRRGVWAEPVYRPVKAADLTLEHAGFQRLQGRILKVSESRYSWWLDLDGPVVIKLDKRDLVHFGDTSPEAWRDHRITLRGWLIDRSRSKSVREQGHAPLMMQLRHPMMREQLDKPDR